MPAHSCILVIEESAAALHLEYLEAAGARVSTRPHPGARMLLTADFDNGPDGVSMVRELRDQGCRAVSGPRSVGEMQGWMARTAPVEFAPGWCVCFPWSQFDRTRFERIVEIDPGSGFGSGGHPSTRLLLTWLHERNLTGLDVLDVGSGTGVLGILAALRGAQVTAIDTSASARVATARNAAWNSVGERLTVLTGLVAEVRGSFDLVVANIHAPVLKRMAFDLRRVLAPGGVLMVSGISRAQSSRLEARLAPLVLDERRELDDWVALAMRFS